MIQFIKSFNENSVNKKIVDYVFIFLIAFIMIQFLGLANRFIIFQGGDNAVYLSLAQSILENHSYSNIYTYPVTPHTQYPFIFPLLISTVFFFFGENVLLTKIIIIVGCAVVMVGTTALIWQEREKNHLPLIIAALVGTIPFTLLFSALLLSEIPYTAFSCLAILFAERALKSKSIKNYNLVLCILFCIISYFTRTIGITLVIAILISTIFSTPVRVNFKQNCIKTLTIGIPFFFFAGVWYLRSLVLSGWQIKGYIHQFITKDTYLYDSPVIGITDIIQRISENAIVYLQDLAMSLFHFYTNSYDEKSIICGLLIFAVILIGFINVIRQHYSVPEFYLVFYVITILAWGFRENRFLIPIFPLLIYYFIKGIEIILSGIFYLLSDKIRLFTKDIVIIGLTIIMLYLNIHANIKTIKITQKIHNSIGFEINPFFHIIATNKPMARMLNLSVFLRNHSNPGEIIISRKPSLTYLASGKPTVGGPFSQRPDAFIKDIEEKHVSYIIVDEAYPRLRNAAIAAINAYPERFKMIYRIPNSNSIILRFLPK